MTINDPTRLPPPGWYPHPTMANSQRYWDGQQWTDHVAPGLPAGFASATPATAATSEDNSLIIAGYVTAALIPLIGFILGIILCTKNKAGHGVACMVISAFATFFWIGVLSPGTGYVGY